MTYSVGFQTGGQVLDIVAQVGDHVTKGQALAHLDPTMDAASLNSAQLGSRVGAGAPLAGRASADPRATGAGRDLAHVCADRRRDRRHRARGRAEDGVDRRVAVATVGRRCPKEARRRQGRVGVRHGDRPGRERAHPGTERADEHRQQGRSGGHERAEPGHASQQPAAGDRRVEPGEQPGPARRPRVGEGIRGPGPAPAPERDPGDGLDDAAGAGRRCRHRGERCRRSDGLRDRDLGQPRARRRRARRRTATRRRRTARARRS